MAGDFGRVAQDFADSQRIRAHRKLTGRVSLGHYEAAKLRATKD